MAKNYLFGMALAFGVVLLTAGIGPGMATTNIQSSQIVNVSDGTSVTVYEKTGGVGAHTFSVSTLMGPGGTFITLATEQYTVTSDGIYLFIQCTRPPHDDVGNNIVATRLNGVPEYPDGLWASFVVSYVLGPDGNENSVCNALGNNMTTYTHLGDSYSNIKLGFWGGGDIICGDANGDGIIDVADVVYLVNYLFRNGTAPHPVLCVGDCNDDGTVNIADVVYLINYLFRSGPIPIDTCCCP